MCIRRLFMGLFSRGMNTFSNVNQDALPDKTGKWYKRVNTAAIIGIFVAVGIVVLSTTGVIFQMSSFMFGLVGTIAILCACLLLMLPWVNKYEKKYHPKLALVFIIFMGVCALLWLVCLYMGIGVYNSAKAGTITDKGIITTIVFVQISLIISLQLMLSSVAATGMIKYKKTNYFLQTVCYISYAFFDFYFTFLLLCFKFNASGSGDIVTVSENITLMGNRYMIAFLVLSVVFIAISNMIMNRDDNRKLQQAIVSVVEKQTADEEKEEKEAAPVETAEEKLAKLKKMFDSELITKEEYESKKADILKDM